MINDGRAFEVPHQKETGQQCKMIFVFDGVRMNTFPARAGAAVRGGVARPRSAAPSLGPSLGAFAVAVARSLAVAACA